MTPDPIEIDASAVLWSAPERERAGRPLLVLLHGYGSHEGDLFGMSPRLPLEPVVASVRAPLMAGSGYSWFAIDPTRIGSPDMAAVDGAARAVLDWLDTVESTSVSLLGFSQGGAIALQLLRLAPRRFARVVVLAGFLTGQTTPADAELETARPRVFWGRGTNDPVISDEAIARTAEWLQRHSDLTTRIYEDLGHGVSPAELVDVNGFLRGP